MFYKVICTKEDSYKVTIDEKDETYPLRIEDLSTDIILDMTKDDALEIANTIINYYYGNKVDK